MRVRVPRRTVGLSILLALLWLAPTISPPAFARPISWEDKDSPDPPPPKGDGDGVVVKAGTIQLIGSSATVVTNGRPSVWSLVKGYLRLVRLGYGVRW